MVLFGWDGEVTTSLWFLVTAFVDGDGATIRLDVIELVNAAFCGGNGKGEARSRHSGDLVDEENIASRAKKDSPERSSAVMIEKDATCTKDDKFI